LERLNEPPAEGTGVGFGKRIGDGTTEAVERIASTATSRSIAATLEEIDHALARIQEGRYGVCDSCGGTISPARLEARPEASLCIECATR
jgi:DnaK suppressor protein